MKYFAVLSDIHANLPALKSVISDAQTQARGDSLSFICLGDVVDYGPHPNECMDWIENDPRVILKICGNHDQEMDCDLVDSPKKIGEEHWAFTLWTRKILFPKYHQSISKWCARNLVKKHGIHELKQFVFFHGGLDGHLDELSDSHMPNQTTIVEIGDAKRQLKHLGDRNALFGHTHYQGYFRLQDHVDIPEMRLAVPTGYVTSSRTTPAQLFEVPIDGIQWTDLPDGRVLINPGSVGQPRWHTLVTSVYAGFPPMACYLLLRVDHQNIQLAFRQRPYCHLTTISDLRKIQWPQKNSKKYELEAVMKLLEKAKGVEKEHSVYRQPLENTEYTRSAALVRINQRLDYEIEHLIRAIDFNWQ